MSIFIAKPDFLDPGPRFRTVHPIGDIRTKENNVAHPHAEIVRIPHRTCLERVNCLQMMIDTGRFLNWDPDTLSHGDDGDSVLFVTARRAPVC